MEKAIIGSGGSQPKKLPNKQRLRTAGICVAIVVLAGGAGVGLRIWQSHRDPKSPVATSTIDNISNQAQNLALSGNHKAALESISNALKQPNLTKDEKFDLYYQQGAVYSNDNDNKNALASYKQAEKYGKSRALYESMGQAAQSTGDTQGAINYYKDAIKQIPAGDPTGDDLKRNDEAIIKNLGGTP
jgi:tetratricopeptide (TPR) repeat protein